MVHQYLDLNCIPDDADIFESSKFLKKIDNQERVYKMAEKRFLEAFSRELTLSVKTTDVVAIHRLDFTMSIAKLESFRRHPQAPANLRNVETRWFVCSGAEQVEKIFNFGFGYEELSKGEYGLGVYLSADEELPWNVSSVTADEKGFRYALLCGVLPGTCEQLVRGSSQTHPTSPTFDSGVDNLMSPKKCVFWATNMNTHLLPFLVVSFRTNPSVSSSAKAKATQSTFSKLIAGLSLVLPLDTMRVKYQAYQDGKIKRDELVRILRQLAGDRLLKSIMKPCKSAKERNP